MGKKARKKSTKPETKNTLVEILFYFIKLFALSLPILLIINLQWYGLQKAFASITGFLLNLFGVENVLFDTIGSSLAVSPALYFMHKSMIVVIDFACTGIRSFYLLFALLFSLNWNPKKQIKYLATGALILFLVNVFRIFSVALLVYYFNIPELFENLLRTSMLNITVFLILLHYLKH